MSQRGRCRTRGLFPDEDNALERGFGFAVFVPRVVKVCEVIERFNRLRMLRSESLLFSGDRTNVQVFSLSKILLQDAQSSKNVQQLAYVRVVRAFLIYG